MRVWGSASIRQAGLLLGLSSNTIQSNFETQGVSMQKPKHEPKPLMAARFEAEAREVLANRSNKRSRFLDVALSKGADFEPVGRLAG